LSGGRWPASGDTRCATSDPTYAFEYGKNTILAIPADKGNPRTIVTLPLPANRTLDYAAITSDGRRIAYVVAESQSDVWMIENFDPEAQ